MRALCLYADMCNVSHESKSSMLLIVQAPRHLLRGEVINWRERVPHVRRETH